MNLTKKMLTSFMVLSFLLGGILPMQAEARKDDGSSTVVLTPNDKTLPAAAKPAAGLNTMKEWPVQSVETGGTLLFSDSPENVDKDGILYADTVEGKARILYYHLNATREDKKVAVILENLSADPAVVSVTRGGMGGPSEDYLDVGKNTQTEYFYAPKLTRMTMESGEKRLLDARMGTTVVSPDKLVYGVFDFSASAPVRVTVLMYPAEENPFTFMAKAKILPADSHRLRGTFAGMDRYITSDKLYDTPKDGAVFFSLADDKRDLYRTGIDATDGSLVKNYGNYGILYSINIPTKGNGRTRYYLKPSGGVYAGVMTVRKGLNGEEMMLPTPADRTFFGEDPKRIDLSDLGTYNNMQSVWFKFSPPGASNLPVRIILMPVQ